ncbi:MAG: efflux RND transporter periplasmic adaptor subunit [Gammaproteobacteria bacterium]|nr:efflux RND transporter periplasmic adaptor subunit [Gammaproteobacteria bacterium]MBU1556254.1 efflux RND transporter periplasmic adaptor subunit [Gammaproteobacteria bacterium]MBU2071757.1 efflux RND transporter periplasmic adaptor subunit [Gammaproteobacteria bacterium]MBU2181503.1 efflux RND transporter periplasmic adaptor subunit [Gammaproteobacteria bacterium]MBU2203517.1 efflux RND transporter periplasmic adaptor subunit [Gammaproteobacteria bacterium]
MDKKISRSTKSRLIKPAVVFTLLAVTVWFGSSWQASAQLSVLLPLSSVSTALVEQQSLQESIALRANVLPQQTVFLDVIEGGRVEEKLAEQGQFVEQGQPLVKLSNTALQLDLISREAQVTEQMNFLRNTQMTIETNRLNLKRDVLDIEHQITTLSRNLAQSEPLVKNGVLAKEHLLNLQQDLSYQQQRLVLTKQQQQQEEAIRQQQLSQLSDSVAMLTKNLEFARQNVQNLLVKAPVSGYLSEFNVEAGESRAPGSRMGQIDIPGQYKLVASVDEFYISRVATGMQATAQLNQQPLDLVVSRIDSRVVNNQFQLEFSLPGGHNVTRGQSVNLTLQLEAQQRTALVLPRGAYLADSAGQYVYVLDSDSAVARKQAVTLGKQSANQIEIVSGLNAGDQVIISGYRDFAQADTIQLQQ